MEASHHRKATQARPDGALYRGIPSVAGGVGLRPGDRQEHVGHCRRSGPMDGHPGRCARRGGSVRDRGVPRRVQRSQNAVRAGRARFGSAAGLKYEGVLAESPAPASPVEVLVERYRRWLVADRGLAEATVVRYVTLARVPAAACDRGRPGREPRRGRHCRVLVGGEHSAQRRFDQGPGGRAAVAAEVSVSGRFGAAAAGHARATGRGLARHRRPQSDPRRRRAAAAGQLRPDQPDRCPRPTAWGQRATQSSQIGCTRDTGVCCSMNSLTRICQAVTPGSRQGRSRRATSYQPSSSAALTVIALHHRSAAQCPPCLIRIR